MRLFRSSSRAHGVTEMLRCMEQGRFAQAYQALKRCDADESQPLPPPHALWRLGRWLAEKGHPRRARLPLERCLELYPQHGDRPEVMRDLARALHAAGQVRRAAEVAAQATTLDAARARSRAPSAARADKAAS